MSDENRIAINNMQVIEELHHEIIEIKKDIAELREDIETLYQCDAKDTKNFNELKELLNCEVTSRKLKIDELREGFKKTLSHEFVEDFFNRLLDDYHRVETVLRELWEVNEITLTENIDGESLEYYQERKHAALAKLDGKDEDYVDQILHEAENHVDRETDISRTESVTLHGLTKKQKAACHGEIYEEKASEGDISVDIGRPGGSTPTTCKAGTESTDSKQPEPPEDKIAGILTQCPNCHVATNQYFISGRELIAEFKQFLAYFLHEWSANISVERRNELWKEIKKWEERLK